MLEGRFKNFKKISGGYYTPDPHASIFADAGETLGKKNDWKMGGGGKKMLLKTNVHP